MYSPVDIFIRQINFQLETHAISFPRYLQSEVRIRYCSSRILYGWSCTSQAYVLGSEREVLAV